MQQVSNVFGAGNIGLEKDCFPTGIHHNVFDCVRAAFTMAARNDDLGALASESNRSSVADPGASTRNENDFIFEASQRLRHSMFPSASPLLRDPLLCQVSLV